jgi:predicted metal-dependent hydrolase
MTALEVRNIPFEFNDVEFIWNPANPTFSISMNLLSFFAIGLEKYFCQAMRDAEPLIKNAAMLEEARSFRAQEAIHATAHRKHVKALIERYPGLQVALDRLVAHFDALYAAKDLKYHLAYAGGLESIFTPSFTLLLDNRDVLFGGGDARVASLLLWHFCEEIEHRSAALNVYNHVEGDYLYRIRNFSNFMKHVNEGIAILTEEFKKSVPDVPHELYGAKMKSTLPLSGRLRSAFGIFMSQMPWHNSDHAKLPLYYAEWMKQYQSGADVTQIFGVRRGPAALQSAAS